jgi:hypothetical protein
LRLSGSNWLVLTEAILSLIASSVAIRILPFRQTAELMQTRSRRMEPDSSEHDRLIAQCRWAVRTWADRVPWRAVCFQRGLALHLMLRRRGIRSILHYGVAQGREEGLRAHVWIDAGGRTVLGGEEAPQFTCLASFPPARRD